MRVLCCLMLLISTGCHAKFKKHAGTLGEVRTEVHTTAGPSVNLGYADGDDTITAIVNVVQAAKSISQTRQMAEALDPGKVSASLDAGVAESIGSGPPFGWTDDEGAHLLQMELIDWGVSVPGLGMPGVFDFTVRTRIYKTDGERVYSARLTCVSSLGDPNVAEVVFGVVNNVGELKDMSDEELQATFESIAHGCGDQLVLKMRRHGS